MSIRERGSLGGGGGSRGNKSMTDPLTNYLHDDDDSANDEETAVRIVSELYARTDLPASPGKESGDLHLEVALKRDARAAPKSISVSTSHSEGRSNTILGNDSTDYLSPVAANPSKIVMRPGRLFANSRSSVVSTTSNASYSFNGASSSRRFPDPTISSGSLNGFDNELAHQIVRQRYAQVGINLYGDRAPSFTREEGEHILQPPDHFLYAEQTEQAEDHHSAQKLQITRSQERQDGLSFVQDSSAVLSRSRVPQHDPSREYAQDERKIVQQEILGSFAQDQQMITQDVEEDQSYVQPLDREPSLSLPRTSASQRIVNFEQIDGPLPAQPGAFRVSSIFGNLLDARNEDTHEEGSDPTVALEDPNDPPLVSANLVLVEDEECTASVSPRGPNVVDCTLIVESANGSDSSDGSPNNGLPPNRSIPDGTRVVEAKPINETSTLLLIFSNQKFRCAAIIIGASIVAAIVGSIVGISQAKKSGSSDEGHNRGIDHIAPPSLGDLSLEDFISRLPEASRDSILQDKDSSAHRAFQWLRDDPELDSYSVMRRTQRFALASLYYSTSNSDGGSWTQDTNWLSYSEHECQWFIPGDVRPCRRNNQTDEEEYVVLSIANNELGGSLPEDLGLLTALESVDIAGNDISGPIPLSVGSLTKVSRFDASNNRLSRIPETIGNLSVLQVLNLENNMIGGPIPRSIGRMGILKDFFLAGNRLSGEIPNDIGLLSSLVSLDISGNRFGSSLPQEIGGWSRLKTFKATAAFLTGPIPRTIEMWGASVSSIELGNNTLTGGIPDTIGELKQLTRLDVSGNRLDRALPSGIGLLENLQQLLLNENSIPGLLPMDLGNLDSAVVIDISNNNLDGRIPTELGSLNRIERLILSKNSLSFNIPSTLGNLSTLQVLHLHSNQLSGLIPKELSNYRLIKEIFLHSNRLRGGMPVEVCINLINGAIMSQDDLTVDCRLVVCNCCNCKQP